LLLFESEIFKRISGSDWTKPTAVIPKRKLFPVKMPPGFLYPKWEKINKGTFMERLLRWFLVIIALLTLLGCAGKSDPLIEASLRGDSDAVKEQLDKGVNVNIRKENGVTPLMASSLTGQIDIVKLLLAKGANPNTQNNNGQTALYIASKHGHKDIVQLLLANGANVNAKDNAGFTAFVAATLADHGDIAKLLLANGANE
jgi:hypothetical protein